MEKQAVLFVTNPITKDRALIKGFKSLQQAEAFGKFRKMKGNVLRPKAKMLTSDEIRNRDLNNRYEMQFYVSQEELKQEIVNYFDIS